MKKKMMRLTCVLMMLALLLTACDSSDYKKAMGLYEAGSYSEACEIFTQLGDYENAPEMVTACRYALAMEAYDSADYDQAGKLFAELGDYQNSADMVRECRYQAAKTVFTAGEYDKALAIFTELGDYADSAEMVCQCNYYLAEEAIAEEDYLQARNYLEAAQGWKDSVRLLKEVSGKAFMQYLQENGKLTYVNTDPGYTVTVSSADDMTVILDYVFDSRSESVHMDQYVTTKLVLGEAKAAVSGSGTTYINLLGMISESEERVAGTLDIQTYRYGDEMFWDNYHFKGHDIYGKPLDHTVSGALYVASNASLERTVKGLATILQEHGLGITLQDLGFASIE